jgi:hypothetical protein
MMPVNQQRPDEHDYFVNYPITQNFASNILYAKDFQLSNFQFIENKK